MVYGLLGVSWAIADSVINELWAWMGICGRRKYVDLIPLLSFGLFGIRGIKEFLSGLMMLEILRELRIVRFRLLTL